jgi:hypothetical protein
MICDGRPVVESRPIEAMIVTPCASTTETRPLLP